MAIDLNRKLTLEERSQTPDGAGGYVAGWSQVGTLWAKFEARSGRVVAHDEVAGSRQTVRIIVRAAPVGAPSRPRAGQRFTQSNRVFGIKAVTELDRNGLYLSCQVEEELAT